MAKRILVPLDGTDETEGVLDLVADAARGAGATVRLLHVAPHAEVVRDLDGHIVAYADQETARLDTEANDYLARAATRFEGAAVERVVRFGEPVPEILLEAEAFGADLIAMTARRSHRLSRLVLGTTTEQICRRTDAPVVIYRQAPIRP
jgi:nucleotide-binding universal stress UspA family protein